ncbi:MAG TPA: copper resistance protein CopC [Streptosporangiaceae bacterium]|nr:copper resistance protein CopC [Streptosporangiaceae bacterium]
MLRRAGYLLAALVLAGMGLLATAPAALAHATLESTSPADGTVVRTAPATVTATFDEQVGVSTDSLRVFAPDGREVDNGQTTHGSVPQQITVGLQTGLGRGTYTVAWHVVSADSHHVQGAFTFSVGAPSSTVVNPNAIGPSGGSGLTNFAFGIVRGLAFASFAVLIGAVMFVICCWPAGASRPGMLRLVMGAWSGLAAATLAAILLQGVYGAGQGLSHVFWPDVLHATLYSRYGRALGVRLVLVVVALIAFSVTLGSLPAASRRARLVAGAVWSALTIGLATTWAIADHAGTGIQVPLAVPADVVHLTAVAVWTGGLATLVTIVLRRPVSSGVNPSGASRSGVNRKERRHYQAATAEAARAVSQFSPIALCCVVAIVITGTYQAWRGVGLSWGALFDTTYGQLLLVKIGAICALVALGNLARHRVQRLRAPVAAITAAQAIPVKQIAQPERVTIKAGARGRGGNGNHGSRSARTGMPNGGTPDDGTPDDEAQLNADQATITLRRLRWSVSVEVAIVTVVLAVTAVLVNTPTARETYTPPATASAAFSTGGPQGSGTVRVTVTPARLGPNELRLSVTNTKGQPYRPQEVDAVLSLPARNLGPLPVKLSTSQAGTYLSAPVIVTLTGQWQLQITIRSDAFDETTITIPVPVH